VGGTGLVASAVPFVASMAPSEKARALDARVEVELQAIQPGEVRIVERRGKPVFVFRRSQDMLDALVRHDDLLADPASRRSIQPELTRNALRSVAPGMVVLEAFVHPSRMHPQLSSDARCAGHRRVMAWRLLLPLPRLQVRLRRSRLQERAGADEPYRPAS
jgi:hypothetical protein